MDNLELLGQDRKERFSYLLDTGINSDVVFRVGWPAEEIPAHKVILASQSQVFASLFAEDEAEDTFELPDDPRDFRQFLKYLYTGEPPRIDVRDTVPFLTLSSRYGVPALTAWCYKLLTVGRALYGNVESPSLSESEIKSEFEEHWYVQPSTVLQSGFYHIAEGCARLFRPLYIKLAYFWSATVVRDLTDPRLTHIVAEPDPAQWAADLVARAQHVPVLHPEAVWSCH